MAISAHYKPTRDWHGKGRPIVVEMGSSLNTTRRLSIADAEALAAELLAACAKARGNLYPPARQLAPGVVEVGGTAPPLSECDEAA